MRQSAGISRMWFAVLVLAAASAPAQDAAVTFTITTPKTEYFQGELIPIQLALTSAVPRGYIGEGPLRGSIGCQSGGDDFIVAPASLTEDPLATFGTGCVYSGPGSQMVILSAKPFQVERFLNDRVRFLKPGQYRVSVRTWRASQIADPKLSDTEIRFRSQNKRLQLVSNVLTLEIRPTPAAWVREQTAAAVSTLDTPPALDGQDAAKRLRAIRTLGTLESPEAAMALLPYLGDATDDETNYAYFGVIASPYRKQLLPLMERELTAPDRAVSTRYIDTLAQVAQLVASGPMPHAPEAPDRRPAWEEEATKYFAAQQQKQGVYARQLVAALPAKQPAARTASLDSLFSLAFSRHPRPEWAPAINEAMAASFPSLPPIRQQSLLESYWPALKGPAMLPILREITASNEPSRRQLQDVAIRRLYELSPAEGREIIIEELRERSRDLSYATLSMLPDATLPELDDVLATRFDERLILRYASGGVLQWIEKAYLLRKAETERQTLPSCAGLLTFYFLKYDPPFGERVLLSDFARPSAAPVCYDLGSQLRNWGRWAYSPALETLAIKSLTSPKVPIKRGAAEVLGSFGSAAAEKPLWETMEYFRSWWKGREPELQQRTNEESQQFELTLRNALAQADAWVLQKPELERLLALCSSDWCRKDLTQWIGSAGSPVRITVSPGPPNGLILQIAQYSSGDEEWLQRKLRQYPDDTVFRVSTSPSESLYPELRDVRLRVEALVRAAGRKLAE